MSETKQDNQAFMQMLLLGGMGGLSIGKILLVLLLPLISKYIGPLIEFLFSNMCKLFGYEYINNLDRIMNIYFSRDYNSTIVVDFPFVFGYYSLEKESPKSFMIIKKGLFTFGMKHQMQGSSFYCTINIGDKTYGNYRSIVEKKPIKWQQNLINTVVIMKKMMKEQSEANNILLGIFGPSGCGKTEMIYFLAKSKPTNAAIVYTNLWDHDRLESKKSKVIIFDEIDCQIKTIIDHYGGHILDSLKYENVKKESTTPTQIADTELSINQKEQQAMNTFKLEFNIYLDHIKTVKGSSIVVFTTNKPFEYFKDNEYMNTFFRGGRIETVLLTENDKVSNNTQSVFAIAKSLASKQKKQPKQKK